MSADEEHRPAIPIHPGYTKRSEQRILSMHLQILAGNEVGDAALGVVAGELLAEKLVHNLGVCLLMSGLIPCNGCTDFAKLLVTMHAGMRSCVAMGDFCSPLLEGCVDEAQVGVVVCLGIHA